MRIEGVVWGVICEPRMFSGWGIRAMVASERGVQFWISKRCLGDHRVIRGKSVFPSRLPSLLDTNTQEPGFPCIHALTPSLGCGSTDAGDRDGTRIEAETQRSYVCLTIQYSRCGWVRSRQRTSKAARHGQLPSPNGDAADLLIANS